LINLKLIFQEKFNLGWVYLFYLFYSRSDRLLNPFTKNLPKNDNGLIVTLTDLKKKFS